VGKQHRPAASSAWGCGMALLLPQAPPEFGWPEFAAERRDPFAPVGFPTFIATTSRSAPVLCIGTCTLAGSTCLGSSLRIRATGSHVPHESLIQVHAAFMPDAIQSVDRCPLDLSRANHPARFRRRVNTSRHVISGSLAFVSLDLT